MDGDLVVGREPDQVGISWRSWADAERERIEALGRWRVPRALDAGRDGLTVFASNDYLGLSQHPGVIAACHAALDRYGSGSGASRLVTGSRPVHHELEAALADWKGVERAVLFPTGYAANLGVMTSLGVDGTVIFSDALNHASIIDGCRLARAEVHVYRHRDVEHLRSLVGRGRAAGERRVIFVTDAVFSMDGDAAPLEEMFALAGEVGALVVVDEAHSLLGPEVPEAPQGVTVLRVGTLSKTLGTMGGFVAGPAAIADLIENRARPYIFSTACTPADAAGALRALEVLRSEEGAGLCSRLRHTVGELAGQLSHLDLGVTAEEALAARYPRSPIMAIILGSEDRAVFVASYLREEGYIVPAIRPPTVPVGAARLRVTCSALHTSEQVAGLSRALAAALELAPARARVDSSDGSPGSALSGR